MLKKIAIGSAAFLLSASSTFAGNDLLPTKDQLTYSGGYVIGLGATTLESFTTFGGNAGAVLQLGYYGPDWMIDLGGNFITEHRYHAGLGVAHLGLRSRIYQNLFTSYGAMGLGSFTSKAKSGSKSAIKSAIKSGLKDEWAVGAFVGLDYQFSPHFMLSAKVYPYNWDNRADRVENNVFANGTISAFYVF